MSIPFILLIFGSLFQDFETWRHFASVFLIAFFLSFMSSLIWTRMPFASSAQLLIILFEQDKARDTESPPDNMVIPKSCSVTNVCF